MTILKSTSISFYSVENIIEQNFIVFTLSESNFVILSPWIILLNNLII